MGDMIAGKTVAEWRDFARRDDCLDRMVPSDLRQLIAALPPAHDAVEALVKAGWDAARKSVYALCEDIEDSAHDALKAELSEHQAGFHSAERFTAKRIRRAMGSMEAGDDDNFRAALAAIRALGGDA